MSVLNSNSHLLKVLELLLDFAYSSRVIINEENAESLLEAGDMLQFHDVRDAAAEFLEKHLHSSNCLGMMLLSDAHQCKRLYELSWRMCLVYYETVKVALNFIHTLTSWYRQLKEKFELLASGSFSFYQNWMMKSNQTLLV